MSQESTEYIESQDQNEGTPDPDELEEFVDAGVKSEAEDAESLESDFRAFMAQEAQENGPAAPGDDHDDAVEEPQTEEAADEPSTGDGLGLDDLEDDDEVVLSKKQYMEFLAARDAQLAQEESQPAQQQPAQQQQNQQQQPQNQLYPQMAPFEVSEDETNSILAHGDRDAFQSLLNRHAQHVASQTEQAIYQNVGPRIFQVVAEQTDLIATSRDFFAKEENSWLQSYPKAFSAALHQVRMDPGNQGKSISQMLELAKQAISARRPGETRVKRAAGNRQQNLRDQGKPDGVQRPPRQQGGSRRVNMNDLSPEQQALAMQILDNEGQRY